MGSWAHEWGGTSVPRASLLTLGKSANIYVSASLFVNEDTMVHISKANGRTYEVPLVKFQSRYQCRATITNTSCSYQWKWKLLSHVRLCDPLDYTVHGMLQARILEWVAVPFSRGSSQPRDRSHVSWMAGGFFTNWATREAQVKLFPLVFELGTFCVLGERDNHYTTETRHSYQ